MFLIGGGGKCNSSNTVAVPQINGFSDSGEVFKIKDNERDYK